MWGALAAYAAVVGAAFTPLYDPLELGRDDSVWILVGLAAAHVGAGAALRHPRALLLPLPVAALSVALSDYGLELIFALIACFAGFLAIAIGWGIAQFADRLRAGAAAVLAFAVAFVPWVWGAVETIGRLDSPHAPPSLEAQLPDDQTDVAAVCGHVEPEYAAEVRTKVEALFRQLRANPDLLVTYTYVYSDEPSETYEITVRELAEEQLDDLEANDECPELQRRLRDAIG